MARIQSLNILLDPTGKAYLKELYGKVIENVQKALISNVLKNTDLSGDPTSGTVEANRYQNSSSKSYGTARTAGKGDSIKAKPVTVPVDVDREIIEELEEKDIKLYGVDGVLDRRSSNHVSSMVRELEVAFFEETVAGADNVFIPTESDINKIIEEMFVKLEITKNAYVQGVDRSRMFLVLDPNTYSQIRNFLDTSVNNANVNTAMDKFGVFHGVPVASSIYLPSGVYGILQCFGSVAQPVMSRPYAPERIPLSEAIAVEMFYNYGTKTVTGDLIWVWKKQLAAPAISLAVNSMTIGAVANAEEYHVYGKVSGGQPVLMLIVENAGALDLTAYAAATPTEAKPFDVGTAYAITVLAVNETDHYRESAHQAAASDVDWTATTGA